MAKKQEVAVKNDSAVVFSQEAPAYINQGAARGSEEVKASDMVLPRLEIVQSLSPIREEDPSVTEGTLFNSVTGELLGDVAYFVPCYFRLEYLIWKDQDEGGGFFGAFNTLGEAEKRCDDVISGGEQEQFIEIVDTPVHYGFLVSPDNPDKTEQIVISMAKSKAKVSRKWNSMIQIVGGDRFSRVYKISTFTDENKQGKKFKNFVVQPAGFTPEKAYRYAEQLYNVLKTQEVRAAHDTVVENEGASARGEI
jgi:hypothetical protein